MNCRSWQFLPGMSAAFRGATSRIRQIPSPRGDAAGGGRCRKEVFAARKPELRRMGANKKSRLLAHRLFQFKQQNSP
jgi:hypothetical protein